MMFSILDMAWAARKFSLSDVDAAGRVLANPSASKGDLDRAQIVTNNWRSCHSFPLNTFQVTLRDKARRRYADAVVAQRLKRLPSIAFKLDRFTWLTLSEMQDIAGCRAVVGSARTVKRLVRDYEESDLKHDLVDKDDYITKPKKSGYRGIHLIYRYYSDRKETYNGLKIEMQFRSLLQHAWATAVETVDTFTGQALKASRGEKEWERFFKLMGTAIAYEENEPLVPNTPVDRDQLVKELREHETRLNVRSKLEAYSSALEVVEHPDLTDTRYFLVVLRPAESIVNVTGYKLDELKAAQRDYLAVERQKREYEGADAVLVSVRSLAELRRAYPNYFYDTRFFIEAVNRAIQ